MQKRFKTRIRDGKEYHKCIHCERYKPIDEMHNKKFVCEKCFKENHDLVEKRRYSKMIYHRKIAAKKKERQDKINEMMEGWVIGDYNEELF